jgi:acyl-CoA thioesterase I
VTGDGVAARSRFALALVALLLPALSGCGGEAMSPATPPVEPGSPTAPTPDRPPLRWVALGDSYTIGTGVSEPERWPNQLEARLAAQPATREVRLVENLGFNGFTSASVIRVQLPRLAELAPDVVTLLIGVNDVVQGVPEETYAANVATILDTVLRALPARRVICVGTPDYTLTPAGADYGDPAAQREGIRRNNRILEAACTDRAIVFVGGIFRLSQGAAADPSLVAVDGLHPSGRQYARWVNEIEPAMRALLDGE